MTAYAISVILFLARNYRIMSGSKKTKDMRSTSSWAYVLLCVASQINLIHAFSDNVSPPKHTASLAHPNRRNFFKKAVTSVMPVLTISTFLPSSPVLALDFDAFASAELGNDRVSAKMSDDMALCKFGQASKAKGEACIRAGMPTKAAYQGGVDAFGNIDRGNFQRCQTSWTIVDGKYVKGLVCDLKD
mmetsp:Transcript_22692/g.52004  ORF Transcript_22692/g.52004 Transcript_22692/m.52004 type:complete len:188 (-) Transcript_22692:43-606(-)